MEITTDAALTLVLGANLVPLAHKMLGPTADYLGNGLRYGTEKGFDNIKRIFQNAAWKLGDRIEQPGSVPLKVTKYLIQEGFYCEEELASEYFGGVLASSRSDIPRDDRGASMLALVSRLTTYQLRSHYIFYQLFKLLYNGEDLNVGMRPTAEKMTIYMPFDIYNVAMDFSGEEDGSLLIGHVVWGLRKEQLIGEGFISGSVEALRTRWKNADSPGIIIAPSAFGVELFLWAHGKGDLPISRFLVPEEEFSLPIDISIPAGACVVPKP